MDKARKVVADLFGLREFGLFIAPDPIEYQGISGRPKYMWTFTTNRFGYLHEYHYMESDILLVGDYVTFAVIHTDVWTKAVCYYEKIKYLNDNASGKSYPYAVDIDAADDLIYPCLQRMNVTYNKKTAWTADGYHPTELYLDFQTGVVSCQLNYIWGIPDDIEDNSLKRLHNSTLKMAAHIVSQYEDERLSKPIRFHPRGLFDLDDE